MTHALPFPAHLTPRPAEAADRAGVAELTTRLRPDWPRTTADLERLDSLRLPDEPFERLLLQDPDGALAGWAEIGVPRMDGHDGWLNMEVVAPDPDLAAPLLAWAETRAQAHGAHTLITRVKENWWERGWLEALGYAEHDWMWLSILDLTTLDFAPLDMGRARAEALGVTFRPLSELGEYDEAQQRKLYDLIAALLRDVPSATPVKVLPFEEWLRRFGDIEHPEGLWLAMTREGDWIGLNELHRPITNDPQALHNGLTGVLPEWRGKGIAFMLKLAAAQAALERGFKRIQTSNHVINAPMLAVNEKMGFVRQPATLTLRRTLA